MTTPAEATKANIEAALAKGMTVTITNSMRAIRVTPKNYAAWEKKGLEMFKVDGSHLCIANGKRYDSIMGCRITAL